MTRKLIGSCLCKKVQFEIPDHFDFMGNCHCSECRKFTGSDYSSVGSVDSKDFHYKSGEEFVSYFPKTEDTELGFCRYCGSSLFSKKLKTHKYNVRLGVLDDAPSNKPSFHIFTGSKAPWHEINDDLPQYVERPMDK